MARKLIPLLILFCGGFAALSWQVLWQMDLSLALGVSAQGTALTIATVMGGMAFGALWAGRRFERKPPKQPWRLYGLLELIIGICAWLPRLLLPAIQETDAAIYHSFPFLAAPFTLVVLALTIGPSCFAMGATLPLIGILSRQSGTLLSRYYATNTAGAAAGTLGIAFLILPAWGRMGSALFLLAIHAFLLAATWSLRTVREPEVSGVTGDKDGRRNLARTALLIAVTTGFCTFSLEVAWFRLLQSSWLSTTDSFAIMLFVFLLALASGAWLSKRLRAFGISLAFVLALGGMAALLASPVLERFDLWNHAGGSWAGRQFLRTLAALATMGPPVLLAGVALPWLLDECETPSEWATIYGVNTAGAVLGSLATGWLFLQWLGPVQTGWLAAITLIVVALICLKEWRGRIEISIAASICLGVAWWTESGIGLERIQGYATQSRNAPDIIAHRNGPDHTTSVIQAGDTGRVLFIDGYAATGEYGANTRYMDAMGRLPMLLHNNPKDALVICFGTGQTARAVLDENPERLTVVDVNPAVFDLAEHFLSNNGVLNDPRVRSRVMDGRAWLRRNRDPYDVVTLEPMPPFFAGVNSLYSVEFYELIHARLRDDGFAAQWFPIHLMTPEHSRAVAAAFLKVFPQSILWLDPNNVDAQGVPQQGILIGRKGEREWDRWPGFERQTSTPRPLTFRQVDESVFLTADQLASYVENDIPVTDNNRILSYGGDSLVRQDLSRRRVARENMEEMREARGE